MNQTFRGRAVSSHSLLIVGNKMNSQRICCAHPIKQLIAMHCDAKRSAVQALPNPSHPLRIPLFQTLQTGQYCARGFPPPQCLPHPVRQPTTPLPIHLEILLRHVHSITIASRVRPVRRRRHPTCVPIPGRLPAYEIRSRQPQLLRDPPPPCALSTTLSRPWAHRHLVRLRNERVGSDDRRRTLDRTHDRRGRA